MSLHGARDKVVGLNMATAIFGPASSMNGLPARNRDFHFRFAGESRPHQWYQRRDQLPPTSGCFGTQPLFLSLTGKHDKGKQVSGDDASSI